MTKKNSACMTCFIIAVGYFIASSTWMLFSDRLFSVLLNHPPLAERTSSPSQWFFVAVSTGMLYWLLRFWNLAVTESQESLRKVNQSLRSFSECSKAITRLDDELELMQQICRICVDVGGHRMAWVAYGENDPDKRLCSLTHWGADGCLLERLVASWDDTELGQGPAGTCIRTGKITISQNLSTDPNYLPWRNEAEKCGYGSCIALPLFIDEHIFGSLVIFDKNTDVFDAEKVALLEELASDLSFGIKGLRLQAEHNREMNERLMLATVMDQTSDGVITFDANSRIQYVNPSFEHLCGVPKRETVGLSIHDFECSKRNQEFYQALLEVFATKKIGGGHFINRNRDGTEYDIDARISPVFGTNGEVVRYVATVRNVTHEVGLQRQLRQAQKMEAVATLSGGIAHDFNNILAIIITNAEMALEDLPEDSPLKAQLELVLKAGFRGKTLVQQVRAISRKEEQPLEPVEIGKVVDECLHMLRSTLPTTIELKKQIEPNLGLIAADSTQIHQVIMNLCTNAGDAMREAGGLLEVSVSEVQLQEPDLLSCPELKPGDYIKLMVEDTGHGLSRDVIDRIFDPFFTSKKQGRGTGLGLSIAHGIVTSHGGHISVSSVEGTGSCFTVLLPKMDIDQNIQDESLEQSKAQENGHGRILFVDDEEDYVRGMKIALERFGYEVTAETDSLRTLELFRAGPKQFDLLITDQTMPHMTGVALAEKVLQVRPDLPIILCSGSSPESDGAVSQKNAASIGISQVLMKPVERHEMNRYIQQLIA